MSAWARQALTNGCFPPLASVRGSRFPTWTQTSAFCAGAQDPNQPIADLQDQCHAGPMRTFRASCIAICVALYLGPATAHACSIVVTREPTPSEKRREAEELIERATAILDGEVVRPLSASAPALVRVERVLKGEDRQFVSVGERHSCDVALTRSGQRLRLILVGGPDLFYLPVDYSNAPAEDRLLGSDRRRDWPYYWGAQ